MTAARPKPGTLMTVNDRCPWPERVGSLAVVVDTTGSEHVYPVSKLPDDEVIVLVNADILGRRPALLPNGRPWSCCMPIAALDDIARVTR